MDIKNIFSKNESTADYFIRNKVDSMIARSVTEGKKREQIAVEVSDECSDPNTKEGQEFLGSISDFSAFPKYRGRGVQENAPALDGSLIKSNQATLTMWFSKVSSAEVAEFIQAIVDDGFEKYGNDYVKNTEYAVYTMSVSFLGDRLRIFHMIQKK